jgi:hypothetical protein
MMDGSSIAKKPTELFYLWCPWITAGAFAPPVVRAPFLYSQILTRVLVSMLVCILSCCRLDLKITSESLKFRIALLSCQTNFFDIWSAPNSLRTSHVFSWWNVHYGWWHWKRLHHIQCCSRVWPSFKPIFVYQRYARRPVPGSTLFVMICVWTSNLS